MEWRNCNTISPAGSQLECLIFDDVGIVTVATFLDGKYFLYYGLTDDERIEMHPTYWMPLPEPPES